MPTEDKDDVPYWKKTREEGSGDGSRTAMLTVIAIIAVVVVLVTSLLIIVTKPQPKYVYADIAVSSNDVFFREPAPSGDNRTAIVPVEIELTNNGEGKSGTLNVWVAAFNRTQANLLVSEFNTSQLRRLDTGNLVNAIEPRGTPGSILRANGTLSLPADTYQVRVRIYEDGGKRTLVSGSINIVVEKSKVTIPAPYVPEGANHGRSVPKPKGTDSMPGFEGLAVIPALAVAFLMMQRKRRNNQGEW